MVCPTRLAFPDAQVLDAIIMGGGLAGLRAALVRRRVLRTFSEKKLFFLTAQKL